MKVKSFTEKAMSAIEASEGALFEAITHAFVDLNRDNSGEPDELETFAGWMIRNFANPPGVGFLYSFYRADLPAKVVVSGKRVRILERRTPTLQELKARFRRFHKTFRGKKGWNLFAEKYHNKTAKRMELERLAIGWIQGRVADDEFITACETVDATLGEQLRANSTGAIVAADAGSIGTLGSLGAGGCSGKPDAADGEPNAQFTGMRANVPGAIIGGIVWAVVFFLLALACRRMFSISAPWLAGLGVALMLFAAPKVHNAVIAVPTAILTYIVLTSSL